MRGGTLVFLFLVACGPPGGSFQEGADEAFLAGNPQEAIRLLRELEKEEGGSVGAQALLRAARIQREALRDPQGAASLCREVITRHPGSEEAGRALFLLGDLLEKDLQRPRKAIEALRPVAGDPQSPQRVEARFRIGRCYLALEEFQQAQVEWRALLEDEEGGGPWRGEALLGIGLAAEQEGDGEGALRFYRQARKEAGTSHALRFRAWEAEAQLLEREGHPLEALAEWRAMMVASHPESDRIAHHITRLNGRQELVHGTPPP